MNKNKFVKKKKIKILYLIDSLSLGGTESQLLALVKFLSETKYYQLTVCSIYGGSLLSEFKKIQRIDIVDLGVKNTSRFYRLNAFFALLKFFKKEKFDIVHTFLNVSNIYGILVAKINRVPVIISTRRSLYADTFDKKKYVYYGFRFANLFVNKIITNSEGVRKFTINKEKVKQGKILFIPNLIDTKKFNLKSNYNLINLKKIFGIKQSDSIVTMIGRLESPKNYPAFLKIAKFVLKTFPDTKFLIVGEGSLFNYLEDLAKKLKISSSIIFTGFKKDIRNILAISDVCMLTSRYEGMPNVVLEYMVAEKPVVASYIVGTSELIRHGKTGFLADFNDLEGLANYVIKLLKSKKLRIKLGVNAKEYVTENFSLQKTLDLYDSLYSCYFNFS